ncbi:lipid-A-disaccharide synthase N-terminal domain-containing protein [Psychroflexus salinarum]|uniref:Lipid-A-disaccharide synthase N-terminal domain-containing protein n=1 Tax=Psychroflexus salinarum TaxID=546024 RepID=A0ABW3GWW4_9FLAO
MLDSSAYIYGIGFIAQILFSSRTFYQWLISEKQKKVIAPRFFWQMSLLASILLFVYGYLRNDFAIMLGQSLTYFIYIRNIQLENQWYKFPLVSRVFLLLFPILVVIYYYNNNTFDIEKLLFEKEFSNSVLWLGILSQITFTLRFVYQWIYSERIKISKLPKGFWVLSLIGSLLIFIYAIFRKDPVLLLGHFFGIAIYSRNLFLIKKEYA